MQTTTAMPFHRDPPPFSDKKSAHQWLRFFLGIFSLIIGSLVYLVDRPADTSYLIPQSLSLFESSATLFGVAGNYLPTFSHVFAFILITAALSPVRHSTYLLICGAWLIIECLFEMMQHSAINEFIISGLATAVTEQPLVEHAINYFQNGRYNTMDMLSIVAGVIAAYFVLRITEK
ncbi:MAG: hypothetical protein L3J62_04170 [Gammaproteobacteria bacterium]|nr:hypothetical protein [Gammaproteobacteria bacterium]MCF6229979.1 hypothetical protein [Gammaproteobacteria bacterium]